MEPPPASALVMTQSELLLELLIVPLDAPAKFGLQGEDLDLGLWAQI